MLFKNFTLIWKIRIFLLEAFYKKNPLNYMFFKTLDETKKTYPKVILCIFFKKVYFEPPKVCAFTQKYM
jgi:hypothetical protein